MLPDEGKNAENIERYLVQKNRAEPEGYAGGQTFIGIAENNVTNPDYQNYGLLEMILSPANLNQAYKKVRSNKGSAGVDEMDVESLKDYLITNKESLTQSIMDGKGCLSESNGNGLEHVLKISQNLVFLNTK